MKKETDRFKEALKQVQQNREKPHLTLVSSMNVHNLKDQKIKAIYKDFRTGSPNMYDDPATEVWTSAPWHEVLKRVGKCAEDKDYANLGEKVMGIINKNINSVLEEN